jgi:cell wall-associated NlpC family hydrolase
LGLPAHDQIQYRCRANLNLYDSPELVRLATQAAAGRQLQLVSPLSVIPKATAVEVCLCEDGYPGWLPIQSLEQLTPAEVPYQPLILEAAEIRDRIPAAIAFAQAAMAEPNCYLWGGTVAPDYDCSGLVQAAFASVGIWLPRDAYQQEAFVQPIALTDLIPGDLIFFGTALKATHVGIYLAEDQYIHSSGKDQGRNGIGIDRVSGTGDRISQTYHAQLRGFGRVVAVYVPETLERRPQAEELID